MLIVRYIDGRGSVRVGVSQSPGLVTPIATQTVSELLRMRVNELGPLLAINTKETEQFETLLAPIDGMMEVWAAGVTYKRSQLARTEESVQPTVYEAIYDAERPELFFKSVAWRVRGHEESIGIRTDSEVNVPEPELAVVCNKYGEVVGLSICNDVSSRSIEGENPLYLPQAKIYADSCALGAGIRPFWEISDPYKLANHMQVTRSGKVIWDGMANTDELHRKILDLVEYLFLAMDFPDGVVLSTGTCLVPELPFTLSAGDVVSIEIEQVGTLTNFVTRGKE